MGEVFSVIPKIFLIIHEYNAVQRNESDYITKETDIMQLKYSEGTGIFGNHIYTVEKAVYNREEIKLKKYSGN